MTNSNIQQLSWAYTDSLLSTGLSAFVSSSYEIEESIKAGASKLGLQIERPFFVRLADDAEGLFSIAQATIFRPDLLVEINSCVAEDAGLLGDILSVLVDQLATA